VIISYRHRFIFFAVPKTGSHALRRALRPQLGPDDLEQVGLYDPVRFPFPRLAALRHGHISVRQIAPVIGDDVFAGMFKFAFVRNPYDRFVSYCAFMSRESGEFERDPRGFMKHVIKVARPTQHLLYRPQASTLVDEQGLLAVDFLGRTETMQVSWDAICAKIGLSSSSLDTVNTSRHKDYRQYYDDELRDLVGAVYRRDLELFGYDFDNASAQSAQDELGSTVGTG
jgi:hypothetical protein